MTNKSWRAALAASAMALTPMPVAAQSDVDRRLDNLERRVKVLETARQKSQSAPTDTLSSWRQLAKGMSRNQVRELLGEPDRIVGGNFEIWAWKNGGDVTFYNEKVYAWSEP